MNFCIIKYFSLFWFPQIYLLYYPYLSCIQYVWIFYINVLNFKNSLLIKIIFYQKNIARYDEICIMYMYTYLTILNPLETVQLIKCLNDWRIFSCYFVVKICWRVLKIPIVERDFLCQNVFQFIWWEWENHFIHSSSK